MIISHKYKFIFIKTVKTAGTSIQVFLSQYCGSDDIVTPVSRAENPYFPRNYRGLFSPLPDLIEQPATIKNMKKILRRFITLRKFHSHIPARKLKTRIPEKTWNEYFKFCVERNPWDKVLSHYFFEKQRYNGYNKNLLLDEYLSLGKLPYNYPIYTDINGEILVDRIIRYENLIAELAKVFSFLGIPFDGTLNVNEKSHYRNDRRSYQEIYSNEQREIIKRLFDQEIRLHGYTF